MWAWNKVRWKGNNDWGTGAYVVRSLKPDKVETDVSNYSIGGVFMQEGHLMAFESKKLNETVWQYKA